jgi:hypothetical protein
LKRCALSLENPARVQQLEKFFGVPPAHLCIVLLENLALRQQLTVLRRRHPQPRFAPSHRLFWVMLWRLWSGWKQALILVQPETVVRFRPHEGVYDQ